MNTATLQRKLDRMATRDPVAFDEQSRSIKLPGGTTVPGLTGVSSGDIETFRQRIGGIFGHRTGRRWFQRNLASAREKVRGVFQRGRWLWEPTSDWGFSPNIVTNEGLAYVIDVAFREVADIAPWYCVGYTNAGTYTPAAGDTYAAPNHDECDAADVDEAVRQAWVDGSPTGTTTRSVAGTAVTYTGDQSFTMQGAAMKGGGTAATTLQNTAGGGTLYCASNFSSAVSMVLDSTVDITYTLTATDDGV